MGGMLLRRKRKSPVACWQLGIHFCLERETGFEPATFSLGS
ncbi:hypothetical protein GPEL0_01f3394 [Geoanaerobacter pelophilus]|uniref:Uncharacterized protein n=1 Tax=Geoanaerobacter pelophilus TaxID=60036 RepID=A0ABQ0ML63_9BACT|nr:hypothetical protein GPEL0_01f3394 [Geoanaerobacter pelophilus]